MTGPLALLTASRSGDRAEPKPLGFIMVVDSFSAAAARASPVTARPVRTAAAPMAAWRIRNVRRLIPVGIATAGSGLVGEALSWDSGWVFMAGIGFLTV